jgi:hypothetical protein
VNVCLQGRFLFCLTTLDKMIRVLPFSIVCLRYWYPLLAKSLETRHLLAYTAPKVSAKPKFLPSLYLNCTCYSVEAMQAWFFSNDFESFFYCLCCIFWPWSETFSPWW